MDLKNLLRGMRASFKKHKYLEDNKFNRDKWYFVLSYGIGDAYLVCSLLRSFIEKNGKVVLIFTKKNQAFIPHLFSKEIEIRIVERLPDWVSSPNKTLKKGEPLLLHPLNLFDARFVHLVGFNKTTTLIDVYKFLLGLDPYLLAEKPVYTETYEDQVNKLFLDKNIQLNRTVLLCPQAVSIATVDKEFWINLANKLRSHKYFPVFMNDFADDSFETISFPLYLAIAVCNKLAGVVSLRSGFCDLIATSGTKKIILYPNVQYFSGTLIESCSLSAMNLVNDEKKLLEIIIETNHEITINNIILKIDE